MKEPCSSLLAGLLLTTSLVACSDQPSPSDPLQPQPQGGSGGAGAGPLVTAGAGSSGTTSTAGGASAGSGGSSGAAGSVAKGGGGAGGAMSSGGASAGTAGAGGPGVADMLDGFRLEAPCMDADHFGLDKTDNCEIAMAVDRQSYQRTIAGDPSVVYDVRLRVRGLAEPNVYVDGALTPPRYYVGGHSSTPDYSAYSLTVADPAQVYYFNYSDSTGHFVFLVDCEVVVPMRGGTQVSFDVNGQGSAPNGHGVSNRERVIVPDIAPAPAPFNGQFMQFDVLSVTAQQ